MDAQTNGNVPIGSTPSPDFITPSSPAVDSPPLSKPSPTATPIKVTADDLALRNLDAQLSMGRASWFLFWAALIQGIISAVGIYLIWATLRATRQSVIASEKSVKAAQSAAEATLAGVATAKHVSDAQTRPWVSVTCFLDGGFRRDKTHAGVDGYYLSFRATAKNHGLAPATNVRFHAEIGLEGPSKSGLRSYCDKVLSYSNEGGNVIFPAAEEPEWHEVFLPLHEIENELAKADHNLLSPVVYGCINYQSSRTEGIKQTRFAYTITRTQRKGGAIACIVKDGPNWMEQPITLVSTGVMEAD